jgi:hypothetical protein
VAFLRVVKSLRSKSPQISVRDGGVWCAPKNCITLAAELLQIAPRTAERIHSSFQELKSLPEEAAVVRERQFVMESVFGNEVIKQWVREHLMACVATPLPCLWMMQIYKRQLTQLVAAFPTPTFADGLRGQGCTSRNLGKLRRHLARRQQKCNRAMRVSAVTI